jgi:hypothetical protein
MDLQCAGLHYVTPGNTIKRHGKDGVSGSNLEVGSSNSKTSRTFVGGLFLCVLGMYSLGHHFFHHPDPTTQSAAIYLTMVEEDEGVGAAGSLLKVSFRFVFLLPFV